MLYKKQIKPVAGRDLSTTQFYSALLCKKASVEMTLWDVEPDIDYVLSIPQIKKAAPVLDSSASCNDPEVMPEFIGDMNVLLNYLNKSITYPPEAKKKGIKGRVVARFLMNRYGKAQNIKITQSLSPKCDAEVCGY